MSDRFNEAGADCPGILPRGHSRSGGKAAASMRPGQTAPEFFASKA